MVDAIADNPIYKCLITDFQPASVAVERFASEIEALVDIGDEDQVESSLWTLWNNLLEAAAKLPAGENNDSLVEFLQFTQQRPGPLRKNGEEVKIWGNALQWKILNLFGPVAREYYDICSPMTNQTSNAGSWVAMNRYLARITLLSNVSFVFDFSMYAIWSLRTAFEDHEDGRSPELKSVLVQGAAVWMEECPKILFGKSVKNEAIFGGVARAGTAQEGKNWAGFNIDRWNFWAEGFEKSRNSSLDPSAKVSAEKAMQRMNQVSSRT